MVPFFIFNRLEVQKYFSQVINSKIMMNRYLKLPIAAATALLVSSFTFVALVNWKVKEGYLVKVSGGHLEGTLKGLSATILFDEAHPEISKITASLDAQL